VDVFCTPTDTYAFKTRSHIHHLLLNDKQDWNNKFYNSSNTAINKRPNIYIYTHTHTHLLTPCSRVLLEKLTSSQLVKKFLTFCGTWMFITMATKAHHMPLSWARSNQSMPSNSTSWRSILISISHLHQGFPSGLLTSVYPPKPCMHLYSVSYVLHASQLSKLFHPFKGTIIRKELWLCPAFWSRDMTMYLVLSAFTSSPISLLLIWSPTLYLVKSTDH